MKKILKIIGLSGIVVLAGASMALAQNGATGGVAPTINTNSEGLCQLITQLQGVFKVLRTLAFVGAAFFIGQWAWGFISKGDVKMDDLKDKGTGLIVGFALLFAIGLVLSFILSTTGMNAIGCATQLTKGWL